MRFQYKKRGFFSRLFGKKRSSDYEYVEFEENHDPTAMMMIVLHDPRLMPTEEQAGSDRSMYIPLNPARIKVLMHQRGTPVLITFLQKENDRPGSLGYFGMLTEVTEKPVRGIFVKPPANTLGVPGFRTGVAPKDPIYVRIDGLWRFYTDIDAPSQGMTHSEYVTFVDETKFIYPDYPYIVKATTAQIVLKREHGKEEERVQGYNRGGQEYVSDAINFDEMLKQFVEDFNGSVGGFKGRSTAMRDVYQSEKGLTGKRVIPRKEIVQPKKPKNKEVYHIVRRDKDGKAHLLHTNDLQTKAMEWFRKNRPFPMRVATLAAQGYEMLEDVYTLNETTDKYEITTASEVYLEVVGEKEDASEGGARKRLLPSILAGVLGHKDEKQEHDEDAPKEQSARQRALAGIIRKTLKKE